MRRRLDRSSFRSLSVPGVALLVLALQAEVLAEVPAGDQEPQPSDLVETTESRLTQVEVSVSGPPEIIADLQPEDFILKINLTRVRDFHLDRDCPAAFTPAAFTAPTTTKDQDPTPPVPIRPVSYLFYFDQPHLTLSGRHRALNLTRQLITRLLRGNDKAMIVSSARRLVVVEPLTDDPRKLLAAVKRLELDREQWDNYATGEQERVGRVIDALNDDDNLIRAVSIARMMQREEQWVADKSLRRLELTLNRLSGLDSHRAIIYFADTMRSNAGEHYLGFFGNILREHMPVLNRMGLDSLAAGIPFDNVINTATARGIRFYPVHAQGLVSSFDQKLPDFGAASRAGGASVFTSGLRVKDATNTLASLAAETGGRVFRMGRRADRISAEILGDFACVFTLSFDPEGFAEDAPLRVVVEPLRDGITIRSKGRVIVESESARLATRLLVAFATDDESGSALGIGANLVPTGFKNGVYSALLQISVPGSALPSADWELGASTYSQDEVVSEVSGKMSVRQPGVPLILESELKLPPGPHEIVAVAHESNTDFILSERFKVNWPNPNDRPATCGTVALLQPVSGVFLRGEVSRTSGSLARSQTEPARTDLPTALMGLVCRGRHLKGTLRVERTLIGASRVEFPALEFELKKGERCVQIRDVIPSGSLGPGFYRYVVRVARNDEILHETSREFLAVTPTGAKEP